MTQPSSSLQPCTSPQLPFRAHTQTLQLPHTPCSSHTHPAAPAQTAAQPALLAQPAEATGPPTGLSALFSLPEILLPCAPPAPSSSRLPFLASSLDLLGLLLWAALPDLLQREQGPLPGALHAAVSVPKQGHSLSLALPGRGQPCVQTPPCDRCSEDIFRMNK